MLAIGESAPALDHAVFFKLHDEIYEQTAYEFEVRAHGIVMPRCREGESRVRVVPLKAFAESADDAQAFELVRIQSRICTEFGYRRLDRQLYLPSDLLRADSEISRGVWLSKTYVNVPSFKRPGVSSTLQVKRLSPQELELTWLADPADVLGELESTPIRMTFASPEFMGVVENWNPNLLPWSEIYMEAQDPFLKDPIVMDGKLGQITHLDRS